MTNFEIELGRTHVTYRGDPYEVWFASVANAEAYETTYGETPGEALHALEREFDDKFAAEGRGNWDEDTDITMVMGLEH